MLATYMTWILLLYSPFRLKFEGSTVSQQSIVDSLMCNFVTRNVACLLTWLYTLTATTWVGVGRAKHNWTRQAQLDAPSTIGCTKHNWMHQAQLDAPGAEGHCRHVGKAQSLVCENHTQHVLHHMISPLVSVLLCHPYILTIFLENVYSFLVSVLFMQVCL